jgi:HAE1 family hydrophobic/amphiphilic exporter-1
LQQADDVVKQITAKLKTHPEVVSVYAVENMENATLTVNLVPIDKRKLSQAQLEQVFSKELKVYPGIKASFGQDGGGGTGVSYLLISDNEKALRAAAEELQRQMVGLDVLTNVRSVDNLTQPEIVIVPKADEAARMGVSTLAISQAARVATIGDIDQVLAKFNDGDRQIPIRVLLDPSARLDLNNLDGLRVPTKFGNTVPLSAVADIRLGAGPIRINRLDRTLSATISADLNGVPNGVADKAVADLPIMKKIKKGEIPGVQTRIDPQVEDFAELIPNFAVAILTGVLLMYVVLVLLFGGFSHPMIILTALPLSFGGAFLALIAARMSISMPSLIGLIMLTGIAAKNSILLVEYAMVEIKNGVPRREALIDAARKRARPIIMTTVAMGAGMIPVAIGTDAFRQPMAVAVIGGLITSTFLSLLVVPVAYTLVDGLSRRIGRFISPAFQAQGKDEFE